MKGNTSRILWYALFLSCLTNAVAEWPTPWSGNLPRPILFVHGINANHSTWGVDVAEKTCTNPTISLTNYFSHQNYFSSTKPLGHIFEFNVTCGDGTVHKAVKKYNTTKAGNRLNNVLPSSTIGKDNPTDVNVKTYYDVEWYLSAVSNGEAYFRRLISRPNTTDQLFFQKVSISKIARDIQAAWTDRPFGQLDNSFLSGLVRNYKEEELSPPRLFARYYELPWDALQYNYPSNPENSKINHNGIEFYSSTNPVTKGADEFARADKTNGPVFNSRLGRNEIGQTDQLRDRITAVLDEYYSDWRNSNSDKIDIACHSQGCLIVRNLFVTETMATLANPINHIRSVIMLTSPQLGTAIATDQSGVPAANALRRDVYSLYDRGCLNPIPITIDFRNFFDWISFGMISDVPQYTFKADPLSTLRELAGNFTNTDQFLAYSRNIQSPSWIPSSSIMRTGFNSSVGYSDFTTSIRDFGYPKRPYDGTFIPITAYYGTVPGLGKKVIEAGIKKGLAACKENIVPNDRIALALGENVNISLSADRITEIFKSSVSSFLQHYPCTEITQLLSDKNCTQLVTAIHNKFAPMMDQIDADWTPFSDLAVDLSSQQIEGAFSSSTVPLTVKPLLKKDPGDVGVPHMTVAGAGANGKDLLGAPSHGKEVLYAVEGYNGKSQALVDANLSIRKAAEPPVPSNPPQPPTSEPEMCWQLRPECRGFWFWKECHEYPVYAPCVSESIVDASLFYQMFLQ